MDPCARNPTQPKRIPASVQKPKNSHPIIENVNVQKRPVETSPTINKDDGKSKKTKFEEIIEELGIFDNNSNDLFTSELENPIVEEIIKDLDLSATNINDLSNTEYEKTTYVQHPNFEKTTNHQTVSISKKIIKKKLLNRCSFLLVKGERKGMECGAPSNDRLCSSHIKKHINKIEKKNVEEKGLDKHFSSPDISKIQLQLQNMQKEIDQLKKTIENSKKTTKVKITKLNKLIKYRLINYKKNHSHMLLTYTSQSGNTDRRILVKVPKSLEKPQGEGHWFFSYNEERKRFEWTK